MSEFVPLEADHIFDLELQDSQRTQYGLDPRAMDRDQAELYASQESAWTMIRNGRPLACLGILEQFAGVHGVAWALLGKDLGRDHLRLTRFARDVVIGSSRLQRLEAIVRCYDVEEDIRLCPQIADNASFLLANAVRQATPQVRWAIDVGFYPTAVLRKFGAAGETHMLLERIV